MYIKDNSWREAAYLLMFAVTVAVIARVFLIAPIIVEGESMEPTLSNQDRMIVNKSSYWMSDPERFDIIVFHASEERDYIKRVIGLPGDTLYYSNGVLHINGKRVAEPYLEPLAERDEGQPITPDFTLPGTIGSKTIPEGYVFVLGDNRRHSLDSRIIGLVAEEDIVGEASLTFWPLSHFNVRHK
ncbi:signal peptidase I [Alteribacillus iranensis]|uniref:Signal peptidase I n=1 Tax=Alteribacillus iranensis TaxID=930128 RepID=A0A1I2A7B9_9BACI|nr:signal peptidase I [Alteribacillus iranensis]SFE39458.1 signal peptidase I [Alteribacillus iranensis]